MSLGDLAALRSFFAATETQLPNVVSIMYIRFFEASPDAALLFKGDMKEQQRQFTAMLWSIVRLTRSSELWPVNAATGQAPIPALEKLGASHAFAGTKPEHFETMKNTLSKCFREKFPEEFTPVVERALAFIFDVVSHATKKQSVRLLNRRPDRAAVKKKILTPVCVTGHGEEDM